MNATESVEDLADIDDRNREVDGVCRAKGEKLGYARRGGLFILDQRQYRPRVKNVGWDHVRLRDDVPVRGQRGNRGRQTSRAATESDPRPGASGRSCRL